MLVSNRHDPDPRVQKEAAALVVAGHEVRVYAFDRQHELEPVVEVIDGVEVERIQLANKVPYGGLLSTARGIRAFHRMVKSRLIDRPADVVHCHDQDTCAVGLWWQRLGRGRFVFDAHDLYWTWLLLPAPRSLLRRAGARVLKRRDSRYAAAADMLIVGTGGQGGFAGFRELYRAIGVEPIVVMNAEEEVHDIPAPPERFTIGFFGGVRDLPMFENLVEAVMGIDEPLRPRLRIAGAGTAYDEVSRLLAKAALDGLDHTISGRFSSKDMPVLMRECSIQYCVYSTERGNIANTIPAKLFTSLAYNRRVIVNEDCLTGHLTESNRWGWCVPDGRAEPLRELLERLAGEWERVREAEIPWGSFGDPPLWSEQAGILTKAYIDLLNR